MALIVVGIVVVIAVWLAVMPSGPPNLVIRGTVTDARTGQPIAGAKVSDDGYGPKASWDTIRAGSCMQWDGITDSKGNYSYLTWPEHHGIVAKASDYKSQRKSLYKGHFVLHKKSEEVFNFALERE